MHSLIIFMFCTFCVVLAKNNLKSLTESMGQEVIEIGAIKELPPGLEEEPSAEVDEDVKTTASSIQPATKREVKKITSTVSTTSKTGKNVKKIDGEQDEEARIEKELAEIYKDTADYKSENSEEVSSDKVNSTVSAVSTDSTNSAKSVSDYDKPIGRQGANFKFQPNLNNKEDIESFRTSVDDIRCDKRATQKLVIVDEFPNSAVLPFATNFNMLSAIILLIKSVFN